MVFFELFLEASVFSSTLLYDFVVFDKCSRITLKLVRLVIKLIDIDIQF